MSHLHFLHKFFCQLNKNTNNNILFSLFFLFLNAYVELFVSRF